MIPPEIIQKVRDASDIVNVIQRYTPLKKAGANWKGLCPFHNEKSPSFNVQPAKQIFHCFGCGEGGDIFAFLVKKDKLSFVEAVKLLAGEAGIAIEEKERDPEQDRLLKEREELIRLLEIAADWFRRNFKEGTEAEGARAYAEKRGLSEETLERFQIGYAPGDGGAIERAALKKGYSKAQLLKCGLLGSNEDGQTYGRFRRRLMFPIQDAKGRVVGFGGRILGDGEPKYLNSPETPLFSKSRLLYAMPQAKDALLKKKRALLTEGYMDAIACQQAGIHEAVAVLGTALTEEHAKQLKRYVDQVHLVFDADQAGLKAALRGAEVLLQAGIEPRVLRLGGAKDPDEFIKAQGKAAFEVALDSAADAVEFFADALLSLAQNAKKGTELSLREKAEVMQQLFPLLAKYATAMETDVQLRRASERLGLDVDAVKQDFADFKAKPVPKLRTVVGATHASPAIGSDDIDFGVPDSEYGHEEAPADAEPPRNASLERLDRELLSLLVSRPDLVAQAMHDIEQPVLSLPELSAAADLLWKHPGVAVLALENDGSEEFRLGESVLSALAMESGARFPNPEQHLDELIKRRLLIDKEAQALAVQRALDRRPAADEEMALLKRKNQLKIEIQLLKQA